MSAGSDHGRVTRIGLVSDTHGVMPFSAFEVLAGVEAIVHAGDVCTAEVLYLLETIAPVTAVRGNCDTASGLRGLPAVVNTVLGGVRILVVHDLSDAPKDPGARVVVSGHTHRASVSENDGVLYVNPGSATGSRGSDPSLAVLTIDEHGGVSARISTLE